jgi:hypothetical protein
VIQIIKVEGLILKNRIELLAKDPNTGETRLLSSLFFPGLSILSYKKNKEKRQVGLSPLIYQP